MRSILVFFVTSCCAFVVFALSSGCKSDRPIEGFDLVLDPSIIGKIDTVSALSLFESSFLDTLVSTGASPFLGLGSFSNIESRILLRFSDIPDTVDITKAVLVMDTNTLFSDGRSKSEFKAVVRKINEPWDEGTVNDVNFNYDTTSFISQAIVKSRIADFSSADSSGIESIRFEFDAAGVALVQSWVSPTASDTHGVLIDYEDGGFIKEFFSRNGTITITRPRIELQVSKNGVIVDTLVSLPTSDAFLVRKLAEPDEGPLYMDNLFSHQSFIKFALDSIPQFSTINRAELVLNLDKASSRLKDTSFSFLVASLSEFSSPNSAEIDSLVPFISSNLYPSTTELRINLRGMLQLLTSQGRKSDGFLLRATSQGRDVSRAAFYSRATDKLLAPKIEVEYTSISGIE